jgi:photosystem II stability/assembly factor-like uncharacterized protein
LYQSDDGGEKWFLKKYTYPFTDIFFIDQNKGFATGGRPQHGHSGGYGRVFKTADGGITWDWIPSLENNVYTRCEFLNNEVGFVLDRGSNSIFKTSNGGESWSILNTVQDSAGYTFYKNDIAFLSEQTIYQAGYVKWDNIPRTSWESSGAGILVSYDGGMSWELKWSYPRSENLYYNFQSMHIIDSTIWVVGSDIIVKSVTADSFKFIEPITDLPLNEVFFSDKDHGWISGGYFNEGEEFLILLKTTDGGENWQEVADFAYQINEMFFVDSLHGWAVGCDTSHHGIIISTEDGGDTWSPQIEGLSVPLTALHFKDGIGWAVGGNGLILRTDNWVTWTNPNTGKVYPSQFTLYQNYPNPFNPVTMINYRLPITSYVELSIYNVLGQKVATLVDEKLDAGYHHIEWDASGLASGVYYYKLEAGNFVQTRKMIYLK